MTRPYELEQTEDRLIFTYEISDEGLEIVAIGERGVKNLTISFCSTPWTCPTSLLEVGSLARESGASQQIEPKQSERSSNCPALV
jgi:hypothetical protein